LIYRDAPKLGKKIPVIGLGTGGRRTDPSEENRWAKAIVRALELGIRLIDTAEIYSGGLAEIVIGRAMREWGGPREDIIIVSKIHPSNLSRDRMRKAIEGTLSRLGTSYVDLYLIHWLEKDSPLREAMKSLEELWKEGIVRGIGVSNFTLPQIEEARSYLSHIDIAAVENRYSLTHREDELDIIPYCNKEGIIYLAYTPLDKGALINNELIASIARKYGKTPAQVVLNWYISRGIVIPIPRASTIEHVEENAGAVGWRMAQGDVETIDRAFSAYLRKQ